jgi:hypothetical protein
MVIKTPHHTRVKLMFKSALDVDYSKLEYDMVLNRRITTEVYGNADIAELYKTRSDWNDLFYRPLFSRTYAGLKKGVLLFEHSRLSIRIRVCSVARRGGYHVIL